MEDDELVALVTAYEVYVTCDKTTGMSEVLTMGQLTQSDESEDMNEPAITAVLEGIDIIRNYMM
jgi:hypothetical protein